MKLQILIPYYQDTQNYLSRLLGSFQVQKGISFNDFEVLIYNDDPDYIFETSFFESYPFKIKVFSEGHVGISNARNYLLDKASAEYIMFCDQDDYFVTDQAFILLFKYIKSNYDIITGPIFIERFPMQVGIEPVTPEAFNGTLLHGRLFKLAYLQELDLKFNPKYDGIEDYYFVAIAINSTKIQAIYKVPLYIWAHNKLSTSHKENWLEKKYCDLIMSNSDIIDYFKLHQGSTKIIDIYISQLFLNCYFKLNQELAYSSYSFLDSIRTSSEIIAEQIKQTLGTYIQRFKTNIMDLLANRLDYLNIIYNNYIKAKYIEPKTSFFHFYKWLLDLLKAHTSTDWFFNQEIWPSFSIICPTHNRQADLYRTVINCLHQTYKKFELIIIDDNSIDNTEQFIKTTFMSELTSGKIKYIKNKIPHSTGASYIRNLGLQAAQNDWITYLDDDDCPLPNFLLVYAEAILAHPESKTFYSTWIWDSLGVSNSSTGPYCLDFKWEKLYTKNFIGTWAFCHHKSLYTELGGFDTILSYAEDWDLVLRYTLYYPAQAINKINYYYIEDHPGESITKTARQELKLYKSDDIIQSRYKKYYLARTSVNKDLGSIVPSGSAPEIPKKLFKIKSNN